MFLEKYIIIERCDGCRHVRVSLAGLAGASQAGRRFGFAGHARLGGFSGSSGSSGSPGMRKRVSDIRLRHNVDTALM